KYTTTVRKDAPWCPSNLEFIRRVNDLESLEAVKRIVFDASYLVMGLGDVYLGAPVATPTDPRHRLVTTKYNPARTWTPENAVGIGGAYLCVYGMEGPGGYQFVGRTLDCVTVFALTCGDAAAVLEVAGGFDETDAYSRPRRVAAQPWAVGAFRFGVPQRELLQFFGDAEAEALYWRAVAQLEALGGTRVEIDFQGFRESAELLYAGPWVSERLAAISSFVAAQAEAMHPVVRQIIQGASRYSAQDGFEAEYKLAALRRRTEAEWRKMDVMLLPTTGTIYKIAAVEADPIRLNTNLGYYTNFVNLLDLAAVAVPAGFRGNGLPFGVTLMGPAFCEQGLLEMGDRLHRAQGRHLGGTMARLSETPAMAAAAVPPGCVAVAVVGAHLSGMPLNGQLTERGAKLLRTTRTAG
ncbi:MAG: carboxyltransferase domain-containing protein, partial [Acidobacteriota bacterium]